MCNRLGQMMRQQEIGSCGQCGPHLILIASSTYIPRYVPIRHSICDRFICCGNETYRPLIVGVGGWVLVWRGGLGMKTNANTHNPSPQILVEICIFGSLTMCIPGVLDLARYCVDPNVQPKYLFRHNEYLILKFSGLKSILGAEI